MLVFVCHTIFMNKVLAHPNRLKRPIQVAARAVPNPTHLLLKLLASVLPLAALLYVLQP